jgi:hypothetical protein
MSINLASIISEKIRDQEIKARLGLPSQALLYLNYEERCIRIEEFSDGGNFIEKNFYFLMKQSKHEISAELAAIRSVRTLPAKAGSFLSGPSLE